MSSQAYVINDSVSKRGVTEPFDLQVSRNQITGHSVVSLYGYQPAVGTGFIPLWENATAYTYPGSALVMTISSASGATDAGIIVQINGLDINYASISESVTLNASGTATTTKSYFRINSMVITSGNAAGIITAVNGGTTYAKILAGVGRTQTTIYTVPAGNTFYLYRSQGFTNSTYTSGQYSTYRVYQTLSSGVSSVFAQRPFISNFIINRTFPNSYPAGTDIQWQMSASGTTLAAGISIEGVLISNDGTVF